MLPSARLLRILASKSALNIQSNNFASISSKTLLVSAKPDLTLLAIKHRDFSINKRLLADETPNEAPTAGEKKLIDMLRLRFPQAKEIEVKDISGGCGSMYAVYVETSEFKNIRTVKQHQLINDVLKAEIKNNMHGLRIQTAVPEN